MFLPSVPDLLGLAAEMEVERDHVLGRKISDEGDIFAAEDDLLAQAQRRPRRAARRGARLLRGAGLARPRFDRVLFDGGEFGHEGEVHVGSEEEMDFLGIPGLLEPDQVRDLLHAPADRAPAAHDAAAGTADGAASRPRTSSSPILRRELNGLVAAWHHRTGQPHGVIHAELRQECGGPAAAIATPSSSRRGSTSCGSGRIDTIRDWNGMSVTTSEGSHDQGLRQRARAAPGRGSGWPARSLWSADDRGVGDDPVDDPLQVGVRAGDDAAPQVAGAGDRVRLEHLRDRREVPRDGVVAPSGPAGSPGSGTPSPGSRARRVEVGPPAR